MGDSGDAERGKRKKGTGQRAGELQGEGGTELKVRSVLVQGEGV